MMSAKGTNVIRATSFVITIEKKKHNSTSSVTIAFVPWLLTTFFLPENQKRQSLSALLQLSSDKIKDRGPKINIRNISVVWFYPEHRKNSQNHRDR